MNEIKKYHREYIFCPYCNFLFSIKFYSFEEYLSCPKCMACIENPQYFVELR